MSLFRSLLACILCITLVSSCANYRVQYGKGITGQSGITRAPLNPEHVLYLIGDTGDTKIGEEPQLFRELEKELKSEEKSSIIFLGDNIYPVGMPPKNDPFRASAEYKLDALLSMLDGYDGEIFFIPGNHDWYEYGVAGVHRQEMYINKILNKQRGIGDSDDDDWKQYFFPKNACGDIETIEINDKLSYVFVDSQWFIENWDQHNEINDGCLIHSRSFFKFQFEEAVRKQRNKNVVVAFHHPLFSYGNHGGRFTAKDHLFPLRGVNKDLYIPLPILGSVFLSLRSLFGISQDISSPRYSEFIKAVLPGLTKNGSFILASGHEHGMQYIEKDNQLQIVSGSGSKNNPVSLGSGSKFAAGKAGFSKLLFYEDGTTWIEFYALDEEGQVSVVFSQKIKSALPSSKVTLETDFPEYEKQLDSIRRQPNNYELKPISKIHKATLGEHYIEDYMRDYTFEVLDLSEFKGGVKPIKRGGGNQTNSLRLLDSLGRQYTMRSMTKDASRALPYPANQLGFAEKILENNFLSAYPFAAIIVTELAKEANVYHTNPKLAYVPKQPNLGSFNDIFGGDVYLIEERLGGDWESLESIGNPSKLISTLDVNRKITSKHKHRIDTEWLVRSKLFDILIKDWDRHDDQWRWGHYDDDGNSIYRPIPRDRDQAFSKYDGVLIKLVGLMSPFYKSLQTFDGDIKNIKWESWNGKYFESNFLGEATQKDWLQEAQFIQHQITDSVIERAFSSVPNEAKSPEWKRMIDVLKQRRNNLVEIASEAYTYHSKKVDILGTHQRDYFKINRKNSNTIIKGYAYSKDGKGKIFYERTFNNADTKEIDIYGFDEDDKFLIEGEGEDGIKIRVIGGLGEDEFIDKSSVKGLSKKSIYYDSVLEKNHQKLGSEAKSKISAHHDNNDHVRKHVHYQPDWLRPIAAISFTKDLGFDIGASLKMYKYGFKKEPYGSSHALSLGYATLPNSFSTTWHSIFINAVGSWDVDIKGSYDGARNIFNYFGLGNNSQYDKSKDYFFNRVGQSKIGLTALLKKRFIGQSGFFRVGPMMERSRIVEDSDSFVSVSNGFSSEDFSSFNFVGITSDLELNTLDSQVDPHSGLKFSLGMQAFKEYRRDLDIFGNLNVQVSFHKSLNRSGRLVLATRLKYDIMTSDDDTPFFKRPSIGGIDDLRAFRLNRFRGDQSFAQSIDLKYKLMTVANEVIPFTIGIHGGFDYGRVWSDFDTNQTLHTSYGGGIYLSPLNAAIISLGYYYSPETSQFLFKFGHFI